MKYLFIAIGCFLSLSVFAQNEAGYKEANGVEYKVVRSLGGNKPKNGDVVEFNFSAVAEGKEIVNTYHIHPVATYMSDHPRYSDVKSVIPFLGAGDSAVAVISCDNIIKAMPTNELEGTQRSQQWLRPGNKVAVSISVVSVKTEQKYKRDSAAKLAAIEQHRASETGKQMAIDDKILQDYFRKNKVKPQKAPSGMYYTIQKKGSGPLVNDGQKVSLMYTAKTISGKAFDSNIDESIGHHGHNPIVITAGKPEMIAGVSQGVKLLNKGTKATFYIPSPLGYGDSAPRGVGSNTVLIYELIVADVN